MSPRSNPRWTAEISTSSNCWCNTAQTRAPSISKLFYGRGTPAIMRLFVEHGLDLESNYAIAGAFQWKHREFLEVYLSIRDQIPTARRQAVMALHHRAASGNLKWVSLLLWAGADPRLPVPPLEDSDVDEDDIDTAQFRQDLVSHL